MTKNCFIISPIGQEGSNIRKNSDDLFSYVLKPILKECGYNALRADMIPVPGMINPHIIRHIIEDELAIADLTGMNPNVFYELAIRHVIGKPYIHLIKEGESIPFDVKDIHTISYSMHVEYVEKAKETIKKQIEYFESGSEVVSPFTMTMDIIASQKSHTSDKLDELTSKLDKLDEFINSLAEKGSDDIVSDEILEKIKRIERQISSTIPELFRQEISKIEKSSSSSTSSSSTETDHNKQTSNSQKDIAPYVPGGYLKRETPNTYTMREWLNKFGAQFNPSTPRRIDDKKIIENPIRFKNK